MALINLRNALMTGKRLPPGVPYVECLNNTTCLCHTDSIARQIQPYTISMWVNISSSQPSLGEGRIVCLTGTSGTFTVGIDAGLSYESGTYKFIGAFIQNRSFGYTKFNYQQYLDNWHNLIITYNGSEVKTYIDGAQKNSVAGRQTGALTNAKLGFGCILWNGSMISGGPMGKYANLNYWDRILSAAEIADVKSAMTYIPTDAAHRYDMNIQNERIADVGTAGGWDFTTIRDFENGVYVPEAQ